MAGAGEDSWVWEGAQKRTNSEMFRRQRVDAFVGRRDGEWGGR